MVTEYFKLLRVNQWTKNLFIFLPLFFGGEMLNIHKLLSVTYGFISFSFMASAVYIINDFLDIEEDQLHPTKKHRPLASGAINKKLALILSLNLVIFSLLISLWRPNPGSYSLFFLLLIYLSINILYSKVLKHYPIIDVFILSIGFVLRIIAGGVSGDILVSHWIVIMTFLLALFLSFAKRRDDLILYEHSGKLARKNITRYNQTFLNQTITIIATITMVSYIMYTVSPEVIARFETDKIYITSIFVLAGILRYLQITIVDAKSGNPSELFLKERFIQACVAGWIATFVYIVYL